MVNFNLEQWKKLVQDIILANFKNLREDVILKLSAISLQPLIIAAKDPQNSFLAITAFYSIISSFESNLLANEIQKWLQNEDVSLDKLQDKIRKSVDQNQDIINEIDYVIKELSLLEFIENKLPENEKKWFKDALIKELDNNAHPILSAITKENQLTDNNKINTNINKITNLDDVNSDSKSYILEYYQKMSQKSQFFPLGVIDEDFDNNKKGFEIRTNDIYTNQYFSILNTFDSNVFINLKTNRGLQIESDYIVDQIIDSDINHVLTVDLNGVTKENLNNMAIRYKYLSESCMEFFELYAKQNGQFSENDILSSNFLKNVVILGDPGSGKSTFFDNLTFLKLNFPEKLPNTIKNHLILRINLRDTVKFLNTNNSSDAIWKTIENDFISVVGVEGGRKGFSEFGTAILSSPCLVLFDGFDEIPELENRRDLLFESIQSFMSSLQKNSRILVTMRPYAYQQSMWLSKKFSTLFIEPFAEFQINSFIKIWYETIKAKGANWPRDLLEERKNDLIDKIAKNNFLLSLGKQPLLLTIITTLHTNGGSLPEDRAKLYEKATTLLLSKWQLRYAKKNLIEDELLDINIRKLFSSQPDTLRYCMNAIAFKTHENQFSEIKSVDFQQSEISRSDILEVFNELLPINIDPSAVIDYISERTGLLLARSNDIFVFPHRSFQEFLSACYILDQPDSIELLKEKVNESPTWWREVYLLAVGRKKENFYDSINLVTQMLPLFTSALKTVTENQWDIVLLATEALIDLQIFDNQINFKKYHSQINYVRSLLIYIIDNRVFTWGLNSSKLEKAGNLLSIVGDTRKGIGITTLNGITVPDIDWVSISSLTCNFESAEIISYGESSFLEFKSSDQGLEFLSNTKTYLSQKTTKKFKISKFPTTNGQFQLFAFDGGFDNSQFWDIDYFEFASKQEKSIIKSYRDDYFRDFKKFDLPLYQLKEYFFNLSNDEKNSPVTGLNYYIASAYCKWLNTKLSIPYVIKLPSSHYLLAAVSTGKIYSSFSLNLNSAGKHISYSSYSCAIGCLSNNDKKGLFAGEQVDDMYLQLDEKDEFYEFKKYFLREEIIATEHSSIIYDSSANKSKMYPELYSKTESIKFITSFSEFRPLNSHSMFRPMYICQ